MSKSVKIYWAPHDEDRTNQMNWNILFSDPKPLLSYYNKNIYDKNNNFIQCPSVSNLMKKTFVIENPLESSLYVNENNLISHKGKTFINTTLAHNPTIKDNILVKYEHSFYFYSEEDIEMKLSSPFFNKSPHMEYGAIVPGEVNINSWFRAINLEFNLWEGNRDLILKENEPIAYISFNTNKNIELVRFSMNEKLYAIANNNAASSSWEPKVPLAKRYHRFKSSRTGDIVSKEIKQNLVLNV